MSTFFNNSKILIIAYLPKNFLTRKPKITYHLWFIDIGTGLFQLNGTAKVKETKSSLIFFASGFVFIYIATGKIKVYHAGIKKCFAKRITVSKYSSFLIQICSINLSTNKISLPYVLLIAKGYSGDTTGLMLKVVTVIFTHDYKLYVYFCSLNVSNLKRQAVAQDEKEFEGISHSNWCVGWPPPICYGDKWNRQVSSSLVH